MRRIFVDTGAFVALRNRAEREHEEARAALSELVAQRAMLLTSNYIFAETYTALLVRTGRSEAVAWGRHFKAGEAIDLVRIDEALERDAWEILESHEDKEWSYVDATSFALMQREGIHEAFAFDHHFAQRGLKVVP